MEGIKRTKLLRGQRLNFPPLKGKRQMPLTRQEIRAVSEWYADAAIKHDGSDECEYLFGFIMAHQDLCNSENPHKCDRFAVQNMRAVSPKRADGYEDGKAVANELLSAFRRSIGEKRKGQFPRDTFNSLQHYGRTR